MSQPPPPPLMPLEYAKPPPRSDLRTIAMRQKAIMFCILGQLLFVVLQLVVPAPFNIIFGLLTLMVMITSAVLVFMLALALYSTGMGVFLGILTLIPLVGLIVLVVINGKATRVLRQHGIHVGLMGAKTSQIPAAGQVPMP